MNKYSFQNIDKIQVGTQGWKRGVYQVIFRNRESQINIKIQVN